MIVFLLQGLGYGLAAAAQPGPFQTYLITQTLKNGRRRTLLAALAPLLSDVPIVLLVLLLLSRIPPVFETALRLASGLFILYLTWRAFQSWRRFDPQIAPNNQANRSLLEAAVNGTCSIPTLMCSGAWSPAPRCWPAGGIVRCMALPSWSAFMLR